MKYGVCMVQSKPTVNGRYQLLDRIGAGGMGAVYRSYDRLTDQYVAVKKVLVNQDLVRDDSQFSLSTNADFNIVLAHEFKMLATLNHPNIINVLDYGFDDEKNPYFTMELLQDAHGIVEFGRDKTLEERIRLFGQTLQALDYLHRRNVVHCDIKPDNVQVMNGHVKVLDFGLSLVRRDVSEENLGDMLRGTMAYIAPETLQTGVTNALSDLYSLGVIGYELFTGEYPYDKENPTTLIQNVLFKSLPPPMIMGSPALGSFITRLMQKDPLDRPRSAQQAVEMFNESVRYPVVQETIEIRESLLQGAQFIGRDKEIEQFRHAIDKTLEKQGQSFLIGGESGVGKTRFLEEVRTMALVKGMLVFSGQALVEDGSAYQLWREILRAVVLQVNIENTEASILKTLLPDLDTLIGRETPPIPSKSPEQLRRDMLNIFEAVMRRVDRPILLILEDLQWVGEGLHYLQHLANFVQETPIMVVGSYRNDEYVTLPSLLPKMQLVELIRFDDRDILQLCNVILGDGAKRQDQLVHLLKNETEGNPFFMVQLLEALAEASGDVASITTNTLPQHIISGGINEIVKNRIASFSDEARHLLALAAVNGRQINRKLMVHFTTTEAVSDLLQQALNARVFEVNGTKWQFAHDKLRSSILNQLNDTYRQELHALVAQEIESLYEGKLQPYETRLAYHWERGGNPTKAIFYLEKVAQSALMQFENQEALSYLNRISNLLAELQNSGEVIPRLVHARQQRMSGEATFAMRMTAESRHYFERGLQILDVMSRVNNTLPPEELTEAALTASLLVPIYLFEGEWDAAIETMDDAVMIYRFLNNTDDLLEILVTIPWIHLIRGQFQQAKELFDENIKVGEENDMDYLRFAGLAGKAMALARLGSQADLTEADQVANSAVAQVMQYEQRTSDLQILAFSAMALTALRKGNHDEAMHFAMMNLTLMEHFASNRYILAESYGVTVEVMLELWRIGYEAEGNTPMRKIARRAMKTLQKYAQLVPIARPKTWTSQSLFHILNNKPDKAQETLDIGMQEAENLNMPYHFAIANYLAGCCLNVDSNTRIEFLQDAIYQLEELDALWDAKRARDELDNLTQN